MSMQIANDQKIDDLLASYQATEHIIQEGSDEHLDFILELHTRKTKTAGRICVAFWQQNQ